MRFLVVYTIGGGDEATADGMTSTRFQRLSDAVASANAWSQRSANHFAIYWDGSTWRSGS